ncbi:MAG TPA: hypothetical protein VLI39_06585 [Sedimentisphaerales bacterium]|nr:hypothetical protein [Sedimentisphaerales bacterium]
MAEIQVPMELFEQFAHLRGQAHREVLGRMELLPVPLAVEVADSLDQITHGWLLPWAEIVGG